MSLRVKHENRSLQLSSSSLPRRLRLIVRQEERNGNLFARLSSDLACDLLARMHSFDDEKSSSSSPTQRGGWTHLDEANNVSISFLPLSITVGDDNIIFASYNGGTCGSCIGEDLIELPRSMIPYASQDIPNFVSVSPLANVEYAVRVLVEPASVEDWELLEIHGDFMENGGLLRQISVIYSNQLLTLRVGKMDQVQLIVKEITTTASPKNAAPSIWPDLSLDDSCIRAALKGHETPPQYALLIEDTEVIVSPKNRARKEGTSDLWSRPLRLIPCDSEWGASSEKLLSLTKRESHRVEPGFVLVHSDHWPFETRWAHVKPDGSSSNQTRTMGVMTSSQIPKNNAVLFIGTRLELRLAFYRDWICLRPLMSIQEQSIDSISLEAISLEYDQTGCHAWNVPDIDLLGLPEVNIPCRRYQNETDKLILPVGAVVPMPSIHGAAHKFQSSCQWLRITSKDVHDSDEGRFVQLDTKDFLIRSKRSLRKSKAFPSLTINPHEIPTMQTPREILVSSHWTKKIVDRMQFSTSAFIALCGVSGSGKTHNALLLSALTSFSFHRPRLYLDCRKLQKSNSRMIDILNEIDSLFQQARKNRNAIIILDDLDILSPNLFVSGESENTATTHSVNPAAIDQSKLLSDRLLHLFEAAEVEARDGVNCHLSVVATCSSADSLNGSILKCSRAPFIHVKVPHLSLKDRQDLLMTMVRQHSSRMCDNFDHSKISRRMEGFLPRDLEKLSLRAIRSFKTNASMASLSDSFAAELLDFTPLARISNARAKDINGVSWADVGGIFDVKEKLEATVRHPVLYRRIFDQARMQLPRGILLYGPSGCGKSYLVPALARECNYPLVTCKGPEILDKFIGASEAKVRELFERASQMAPSILFLDELEALAPRRGSDSTGVTDRVVNQLLTFLDGVEDVSSGTVFIIGATSRPDKVDPAIIRPGRLEQHLYVGPPESTHEWSDLLVKISKQWSLKPESAQALSSGKEIPKMVKNIPRICPADIRAAFDTAHLNAVHRLLARERDVNDIGKIELEKEDILYGLAETKPSLSETEAKILEPLYDSLRGKPPASSDAHMKSIHELKTSLR